MFVCVKQWYINEAVPAVLTAFRDFFQSFWAKALYFCHCWQYQDGLPAVPCHRIFVAEKPTVL
jgi:hypothetical protein